MKYTVCIQAAGVGSRLTIGNGLHKALIPINKKTVLSRIIDLYPSNSKFIVLVGYKKDQIKAFIDIVYPHHDIEYIDVKNYTGAGTGPGYSLLQAKNHVQGPFIFMACDTIVLERPPLPNYNWIGISPTNSPKDYLVSEVVGESIVGYFDKKDEIFIYENSKIYQKKRGKPFDAFIGLAGIHDYNAFWAALENDKKTRKGEIQVTNGLNALIKDTFETRFHKFTWIDTGTDKSYSHARTYFKDNFLLKTDEFLYQEKNKIIKFFLDSQKAEKRFERTKYLNNITPKTYKSGKNFIWYEYVRGPLISNTNKEIIFSNFLKFMSENIWKKTLSRNVPRSALEKKAYNFYKTKTFERVKKYLEINKEADKIKWINNTLVEPIFSILDKVDWEYLTNGEFAKYHGDPQPENVIVTSENGFTLIDWREDFGGDIKYGDIYYDFGKIYHSLILTQKKVREKRFFVNYTEDLAFYKFSKRRNLIKYLEFFESFIERNRYDLKKVKLISALIYLNIAPLHHHPYSDLLFFHGKLELTKLIK